MISAYSMSSLVGYVLFYLGTYLALPAVFDGYRPPGPGTSQYTPNFLRLGAGIALFAVGGVLQVAAEFFWGYVF